MSNKIKQKTVGYTKVSLELIPEYGRSNGERFMVVESDSISKMNLNITYHRELSAAEKEFDHCVNRLYQVCAS